MTLVRRSDARHPFQGVLQIVRFNWPFYVIATAVSSIGLLVVWSAPGALVRILVGLTIAPTMLWAAGSLVVSHYVYDRSELPGLEWLARALPTTPRRWLLVHAGLDESSERLEDLFPDGDGLVLDFYDPDEMSEASIRRARQEPSTPARSRSVSWKSLPLDEGFFDTVFLIFAAHELRRESSRLTFFREIRRVLEDGGRLILVEHLRDAPNFLAFGPGFLHFLSRSTWVDLAEKTELSLETEFAVTPFVKVFVVKKENRL